MIPQRDKTPYDEDCWLCRWIELDEGGRKECLNPCSEWYHEFVNADACDEWTPCYEDCDGDECAGCVWKVEE